MHIPKKYGESRIDVCPFCDKASMVKNKQGIPVCNDHKERLVHELKCACGEYLDIKTGKFGVFFNCMSCGNMSMKKALAINK